MKTIIAGSREIYYPQTLQLVEKAVEESGWKDLITEIVSGCARGIDSGAILFAKKNPRYALKKMKADWSPHSRSAGILRNISMAEYADALIAIWDGMSPGTKNMIEEARKRHLKVHVMLINPPQKGFNFGGNDD